YQAGARFVLVQGVHHDNFDNWNSHYNPWNIVNWGAQRDTMAEWTNALRQLGMRYGVAFHHEYSWWFTQSAFNSDATGPFAGVPYDAVTATNSAGKWWAGYDVRQLYNQDLRKYQGAMNPGTGYYNPAQGIFADDLDYGHWYATQWALRMLDVVENYDPDFIYTDGNSTQPFSGYATGTGYKCDAMQRVIAHFYNRALQRHGPELDRLAVVKFHAGDRIGTTWEGGYSPDIYEIQPWFAEMAYGDWYWHPGITYDQGGSIIQRLLEAVARDGAMMVNVPNRPDGALDSGATNMLQGVGQWLGTNSEGIYGSRAWAKPTEGNFRFTVGTNGMLYAYYLGIPAGSSKLTITSLAASSNLLVAPVGTVALLGSSSPLTWSQTATGLVITLPATLPPLPSGTAIGLKIGPASAIGTAPPVNVIAQPGANQIVLSWYSPSVSARFTVKRAAVSGGPYTTLATNLTNQVFYDTNVSSGILYSYVVTATEAGGESANSVAASAAVAGPPANVWLSEDIGAVGTAGTFTLTNGVFTVQGSGADIWGTADAFRFGFQTLTGDCALTARVASQQNTAGWAKAGLMIRETLDASSKYVLHFLSPANGAALQQRATTAGSAAGISNPTGLTAPYWLRLVRAGDLFSAFVSVDGLNWVTAGTTTVPMNANVYVGLAVCSTVNPTLCRAQFDNVSFATSAAVILSPLPTLIHRWSFNETGGTVAHDSLGAAHGTLNGSAVFDGHGRVVLNGTSGTYLSLPANLLAGLTNVTMEAWLTNAVTPDNVALFSFDDGLQDGVGTGYLRYVLHDQSNGRTFLEQAGGGGNPLLAVTPGLGGKGVHLVCTFNPPAGGAAIYTNGVLAGTLAIATSLANISTNAAALGRSPWNGDPWLNGTIDEFRIYAGQLLPADIAATQILGPNALLTTNVALAVAPGNGTLNLSWPVASSGYTLQSSTSLGSQAKWTTVTNAVVTVATNNQIILPATNSTLFFRLQR
ncbi:MAG TPA: alpha-L-fucosidase, partial [Verrucomicrobiae bacterium]